MNSPGDDEPTAKIPPQAPDPDALMQPAPDSLPPPPITAQPPQLPPEAIVPTPAPVPAGTHEVKGSRSVEGTQLTPEAQQGHAGEFQVISDEKKLAADQAATQGQTAKLEQEHAQKVAEETARQNAAMQAEQQRQIELQQKRDQAFAQDLDSWKRQKPPGGFSEWSGGKKAQAYLAIALGGLGRGATNGVNTALQHVQKGLDDEQKRFTDEHTQQLQLLEKQHGWNQELDARMKDVQAQGLARKALAIDSLDKFADANLKALGIPAAQQAGIKAQLGFDREYAKTQQQYGQLKVTDTTQFAPGRAGVGGQPNGALSKLHEFARTHLGPEQEAQVVAEAERLFPGQKPAQLQTLVAGAVKASQDAKVAGAGMAPKGYTDVLSGQTLPVDPTKTDARQHNEATAKLKPINTFLSTAQDLLATNKTAGTPEWARFAGADVSGQSKAQAAVTRLRSAYAAVKQESVGKDNAEHLAETAIPDPPTKGLFNDARMKAWRTKMDGLVEEMVTLRKEGLANAGVPLDVIDKVASGKGETKAAFTPGKPKVLNGKVYVEVGPNDWQPEGGK